LKIFCRKDRSRVGVRGSFSKWAEVVGGGPQGSVLGPPLFLLYVNSIPSWIQSSMKLFADDARIWRKIEKAKDSSLLQSDLHSIEEWSET